VAVVAVLICYCSEATNDNKDTEIHLCLGLKIYTRIMKTEKAFFKVVGMYCITCKPIVEKQLRNEKAVKKIDINYMTDSVVVEFDSSLTTKEEIKNRLEKSGYKFVRTPSIR
jgi:copper chaperone